MIQMRDQNVWNVEWSGVEWKIVVELQVVCLVMELEAALEMF
jgi:hypothetical protein